MQNILQRINNMNLPKNVWHWAFYDFANSSYVLIFQAFLLPAFFSTVLFAKGYSLSAWGIANGISTAIGVLLAIILGKYADKHDRLKIFKWIILACFAGMTALSLFVEIFASSVLYLFIITNSLFITSLSLSDSILPYVSNKNSTYEHSGFAWGFGYLGGIASLIIVVILQKIFSEYSPIVFLSVAIFYVCFSLYALNGLKDTPLNESKNENKKDIISKKQKISLLIGYWLISESITVIILFFSIFAAKELGFSTFKIGVSLLLVQLIGFPATWLGGALTKRFNTVSLLGWSIVLWGIVIALMITSPSIATFALVVFLTGLTIGNSQSLIRAQYSTIIHKSESGYQFGIYAFISQAATSIGPIMYGLASDSLGSQKVPMIFLFVLMVTGFAIIRKVMKNIERKPETVKELQKSSRQGATPFAQTYFHGTKADIKVGELIEAGFNSNYGQKKSAKYIFLAATLDAAIWGAELAFGEGRERIYAVEPTGEIENDPDLTDRKFPGNPTKSYRSTQPFKVIGEITAWQKHPEEQVKAMKNHIEKLKEQGINSLND